MAKEIIVTTGNDIPGKKIKKILGIVRGNTVRARNIGRDIGAAFKHIVGGEIKTYTELTTQSRDEAFNRMVNNAIDMGAGGNCNEIHNNDCNAGRRRNACFWNCCKV